jgi:hypothetical protein
MVRNVIKSENSDNRNRTDVYTNNNNRYQNPNVQNAVAPTNYNQNYQNPSYQNNLNTNQNYLGNLPVPRNFSNDNYNNQIKLNEAEHYEDG